MEKDKILKQILEQSAAKAPENFSAKVMGSLPEVAPKTFVYQPLIPLIIQKCFLFFYLAVITSIIVLSIWVAFAGYHFNITINLPLITVDTTQKVLTAIVVFWILFGTNQIINQRTLDRLKF